MKRYLAIWYGTRIARLSGKALQMKITRYLGMCFLGLASLALHAQVTTTTMIGTVADKTGAVVATARVTATNTGTNLERSVNTNEQGEYRIDFLPVGEYTVTVEAPGFKKFLRKQVTLDVAQTARVDVALEVGST